MKKAKFLQDAKLDPARFYRNPADVMRDRRLTDQDRREIIAAWERHIQASADDGVEQLERLRQLREQLDGGFPVANEGARDLATDLPSPAASPAVAEERSASMPRSCQIPGLPQHNNEKHNLFHRSSR